jgi:hypothetical protein
MTDKEKEKISDECEADLKEIAHWFGGWDELRKVIGRLEDNENEAAWERHTSDYDAVSIQERMEQAYKQKYS